MKEQSDSSKLTLYQQKMSQLEKAQRDADRLRQEAIAELIQARKQINRELRQLGYEGGADDGGAPTQPRGRASSEGMSLSELANVPRGRRRRPAPHPDRHCSICNVDGHDMRAHRAQIEKVPFTAEEMREKGLAS